ncbi:MAG: putative peptidoglycan glycosyltransferase FtsW [Candidatus Paceibacterota bacterium]
MRATRRKIDLFFLTTVTILTLAGFIIFLSASLGLLAQNGASFNSVALKQTLSLVIGLIAFIVFSKINYTWLRKGALFILLGAIAVNLLLFIPALTLHYNGASRWLILGGLSFQPSELLKIAFIIYLAAWAYFCRDKIKTIKFGLVPYAVILAILSALLLAQRDTDTLVIIAGTGLIMLFIAGLPLRHLLVALGLIAVIVSGVIATRPYALDRVQTFLNKGADSQGSGYQINQSLIAIGSGQITGRGFGQSVQKFGYLPQPTDDSIFAVAAEEFGFVGSSILILLYLLLAISIFRIGNRAPDIFGGSMTIGIAVLIIAESFMNIAAMLGLVPLSGIPLLFVSHGGTALIITLMTMGIVANVSKHIRS